MTGARTETFRRLKRDVIGPRGGCKEVIPERPSSRYLTGILFPQGSVIGQDEDDDIDQTENADDGTSGVDDKVSLFASLRPSTVGLSFAVCKSPAGGTVSVGVSCARYLAEDDENEKPRAGDDDRPIVFEQEDHNEERFALAAVSEDEVGVRRRRVWRRHRIKARFEIKLQDGDGHSLDDYCQIECVWKVRRAMDVDLVTVQFVNNVKDQDLTFQEKEESTLFQFQAVAICGAGAKFVPRPHLLKGRDEDQEIADLIYRNVREYAIGHTSSAAWRHAAGKNGPKAVFLTWMPTALVKQMDSRGDPIFEQYLEKASGTLDALSLAFGKDDIVIASATAVCSAYEAWIEQQNDEIGKIENETLKSRASDNLSLCREAARRMGEGVAALRTSDELRKIFRLANRAMYVQFAWSKGSRNALDHRLQSAENKELVWRPFQLAFLLMCLSSSADDKHPDRDIFDLIWFPTGGGKTEAYLFLAAFVLFHRRHKYGEEGGGVGALMRYTLRTLTVQQFERAASMVVACELIRREVGGLGQQEFSIGLWVGAGSTPNNFQEAKQVINDPDADSTPRQLTRCPVCLAESLRWVADEDTEEIYCECSDGACVGRLPVLTVDTDIYRKPPSLLIGTVDKFAQIVRNPNTSALFGISNSKRAPDLIIQDELHLISGPLGSMAGLYEMAIDRLCSIGNSPPKIVGSTATIRRASEQVRNVFNRRASQFPSPAIDWENSCFAKLKGDDPGRFYVGLTTAGRSEKFALQAVAASLLQSGDVNPGGSDEPYKTLVAYFNSLKTLGGAMVLLEDDALMTVRSIAQSRGEEARRNIATPEELTSRKSSREIPKILNWLKATSSDQEFIDILLASNMLSVGVDIPRLGLMLMAGQPKSMSEYIQATSRVGRSHPGLVVTLYNNAKIRDRAHFEAFCNWHGALYRGVEPGSVTPFAPRARDKALHAPLVALAMLRDGMRVSSVDEETLRGICDEILERVRAIDPNEEAAAAEELSSFVSAWSDAASAGQLKTYWNDKKYRTSLLMSAEQAAARRATGAGAIMAHPTPNSLRNVEPSVTFKIRESARDFAEYRGKIIVGDTEVSE
jgi:hypothetical protein